MKVYLNLTNQRPTKCQTLPTNLRFERKISVITMPWSHRFHSANIDSSGRITNYGVTILLWDYLHWYKIIRKVWDHLLYTTLQTLWNSIFGSIQNGIELKFEGKWFLTIDYMWSEKYNGSVKLPNLWCHKEFCNLFQ